MLEQISRNAVCAGALSLSFGLAIMVSAPTLGAEAETNPELAPPAVLPPFDDDIHEAAPALLPPRDSLFTDDAEAAPASANPAPQPEVSVPTLHVWPAARNLLPPRAEVVPSLQINRVAFEDNTAISDADLRAALHGYLDRPLVQEELDAARSEITRQYINRGYISSGATIPDQELMNGELTFQITEGHLAKTFVEGTARLQPSFFSKRVARAGQAPLHFPTMQHALQVLQTNPNIKRLNAELKPGPLPGEALMVLNVEENPAWSYGIDFHNYRPPSTGAEQVDLWARTTNLSGASDTLHARLGLLSGGFDDPKFSDLDNLFLRYQRPILADDTTLEFYAENRDYLVNDEVFAPLDIEGKTWRVGAGLRRPILRTFDNEHSIQNDAWWSLMLEKTHSETSLLGEPFSINPGTVNGELDLTILRCGTEWTRRTSSSVLALRSTLSLGLDTFGATDVPGDPDETFLSWTNSMQYLLRMHERGDLLLINGGWQLSDGPMPSQERWVLGGRHTVRGYRENTLVRDNGFHLGAEYRYRVSPEGCRYGMKVFLAPFIDTGYGWNHHESHGEFLASVGLGLQVEYHDRVRAEIYWGQSLNDYEPQSGNLQDAGIHFKFTVAQF